MKRVRLTISGFVQGVLFRHHTRRVAMELGVNGYVKNQSYGRVEVVIEGMDDRIKRMIEFCKVGPEAAHVKEVKIQEEQFTGEFDDFEIRNQ